MATSTFQIGGLISGLNTNDIISQLMAAERQPLNALAGRRALYQAKVDAWASVKTKLANVTSKAQAIDALADFEKFAKVTSSSESVKVSVTGAAAPGTLSFTVDQLARSHQLTGANNFSSATDLVGAGTFTITKNGTNHDFATTASTTITQLAQQINASDAGVSAAVISPDGTNYKLVLTAKEGGTANTFTTSATQGSLATFNVAQAGLDATLTVGSGAGAMTVTRSSNVITDLMPGVTVTLAATSATPVTVEVQRDTDASVTAVKAFIDEINKALTTIGDLTKYDSVSKKAGLLQGDASAWGLTSSLRTAVSDVISQLTGTYTSASAAGIMLQRDGTYLVDETKLRDALNTDPTGVATLFARSGSTTDTRVEYVFASDSTTPGTYNVQITSAADVARVTGIAYVSPAVDDSFTITQGTTVANITVTSGSTIAQAISAIQSGLTAAGITSLKVTDAGGSIRVEDTRYGAGNSFTVAGDDTFGLNGSFAGVDVAGTIDGALSVGTGQVLRADTGVAEGLQVKVTATAAEVAAAGGTLALGSITYSAGISGRVASMIGLATEAEGSISVASDRWTSQIKLITDRMSRFEERLIKKEELITRQFAAMETAMQKLTSQANWLAAQMSQGQK